MIQGIIFDYGGTIDTNATHWSEVLWEGYKNVGIPVCKDEFRASYVFAERCLARHPYIKPEHNFLDTLNIKCDIETKDLVARGVWQATEEERKRKSEAVARFCYGYVIKVLELSRPIVERLSRKYPLVLVSNFYGNIKTVLEDFRLQYFCHIVESAIVGIRKPNPQIFQLGVDALRNSVGKTERELSASDILVVGDSFSKDIVPATQIGCKTVWIRGLGWGEEQIDESLPTYIIDDIAKLEAVI